MKNWLKISTRRRKKIEVGIEKRNISKWVEKVRRDRRRTLAGFWVLQKKVAWGGHSSCPSWLLVVRNVTNTHTSTINVQTLYYPSANLWHRCVKQLKLSEKYRQHIVAVNKVRGMIAAALRLTFDTDCVWRTDSTYVTLRRPAITTRTLIDAPMWSSRDSQILGWISADLSAVIRQSWGLTSCRTPSRLRSAEFNTHCLTPVQSTHAPRNTLQLQILRRLKH